jgi:Arc/MetJ-type ribon-helix-helix transcriptional regulator
MFRIYGRSTLAYADVKHLYIISDTDASDGDGTPEKVQINLRLTRSFLEDIDATWKDQGFNSRSEFLRHAARDAVKHPEFSREGWKQIAASEHDLRSGTVELVSRDKVVAMMDREDDAEE